MRHRRLGDPLLFAATALLIRRWRFAANEITMPAADPEDLARADGSSPWPRIPGAPLKGSSTGRRISVGMALASPRGFEPMVTDEAKSLDNADLFLG